MYQTHDGHVIHNGKYPFEDAHCHSIKSLDIAKQIIETVHEKKIPHTKCGYLFDSHIRLAGDTEYRDELINVRERRRNRNQMYFNSNKRIR